MQTRNLEKIGKHSDITGDIRSELLSSEESYLYKKERCNKERRVVSWAGIRLISLLGVSIH